VARGHHWIDWVVSRKLCCTCGLLWLRNEVSNREARKPCRGRVD
jgi:hypothetical protein